MPQNTFESGDDFVNIKPLEPEQIRKVQLLVADKSETPEECRMLLEMLGIEGQGRVAGSGEV